MLTGYTGVFKDIASALSREKMSEQKSEIKQITIHNMKLKKGQKTTLNVAMSLKANDSFKRSKKEKMYGK